MGVYDLVLEGSVRNEIEYRCAVEQGRPHKKLVVHEGARVKNEDGVYQLSPSTAPVSALGGGVLGLTREELGDFSTVIRQRASSKGGAQQTDIRPLKKQERETLLKIIVALAAPFAEYIKSHPPKDNEAYSSKAEEALEKLSDASRGRTGRSRNVPRHHRCTCGVQVVRPIHAVLSRRPSQQTPRWNWAYGKGHVRPSSRYSSPSRTPERRPQSSSAVCHCDPNPWTDFS